jgi:hypothetical protein
MKTPIVNITCNVPPEEQPRDVNMPHLREYTVTPANSTAWCLRSEDFPEATHLPKGLILITTYHSVRHARGMHVRVSRAPDYGAVVELLCWNPMADVAVLRIAKEHGGHLEDYVEPLGLATVCDPSLWGSEVVCYGFPSGMDSLLMIPCEASSLTSHIASPDLILRGATDPGSSGGPVVRVDRQNGFMKPINSEVIGLVAGGSNGKIHCCPADLIRNTILSPGMSNFLLDFTAGINLTREENSRVTGVSEPGILHRQVPHGSILDLCGVLPGDVILGYSQYDTTWTSSHQEYYPVIGKGMIQYSWHGVPLPLHYSIVLVTVGTQIDFRVIREGRVMHTPRVPFSSCRGMYHQYTGDLQEIPHRIVYDSSEKPALIIRPMFIEEMVPRTCALTPLLYGDPQFVVCYAFPESTAFLLEKFKKITVITKVNSEPITAKRIEDFPDKIESIETTSYFYIL